MRQLIALFFACLPALASSQELPALYNVRDVASIDVLNIRAAPSASSDIIGTLAFDATDIEVVAVSGTWGQVNTGERAGWVATRYLTRQSGQDWARLPRPLSCFGTEPFWSLTLIGTGGTWHLAGNSPETLSDDGEALPAGTRGRFGIMLTGASGRHAGVLRQQACNDGMSDRAYGIGIDVMAIGPSSEGVLYSGCCSLVVR